MTYESKSVTLLTGASGGLGFELAQSFLEAGRRDVVFQYRTSAEKLFPLLKKYDLSPEKYLFVADLTNETNVLEMRQSIEAKNGVVGALINLAGGSSNGMSWKLSLNEFQQVVNMNLTSTFLTCREFIPGMRNLNQGRIINISSVVAFSGIAGASHYCAAKAGVVGLTKALSHELASKNITVNALALGYFNKGLIDSVPESIQEKIKEKIPINRFGTVSEIFACLQFLLSQGGGYTTGQVIHINGGLY